MLEVAPKGSLTSAAPDRLCLPVGLAGTGRLGPGAGGGCVVMIYGPGPAFCDA